MNTHVEAVASSVNEAVAAARVASRAWSRRPASRSAGLRAIAAALAERRDEIIAVAVEETALTAEELAPEFVRMVETLRMFAGVVDAGSWTCEIVDPAPAPGEAAIGPAHDLRATLVPLGPVAAVFGASNFPLAYGVCGGDTSSALAAGLGVVIKEHPAHPRTGRLLAGTARGGLAGAGCSPGLLGYVANTDASSFEAARALVMHEHVAAVGFTGSTVGGLSIEALARSRATPIPVFAELGSMNLIVALAHAASSRLEPIARAVAGSLLARHGQQCTAPGMLLVVGPGAAGRAFESLAALAGGTPPRRMLSPQVARAYWTRVDQLAAGGAMRRHTPIPPPGARSDAGGATPPVIFEGDLGKMLAPPAGTTHGEPWEEVFGPAMIVAGLDDGAEPARAIAPLRGALTVTILADEQDEAAARDWMEELVPRVGRIIVNGVPTGVRVCGAMVHGGPFPATNAPHTTAVGPRAIHRWCRPVCIQNAPGWLAVDWPRAGGPGGR